MAPGGYVIGSADAWKRRMVRCESLREYVCRWAYERAGWTSCWPYELMPDWLRPGWHHETAAVCVRWTPR